MSTKEPIESATCPESCETGWRSYWCKVKSLVCRLQKYIDPLCERKFGYLTLSEFVSAKETQELFINRHKVFSEGLAKPIVSYTDLVAWLELADKHEPRHDPFSEIRRFKAPLSFWNRIGMAFAYGTGGCPCCVAYRAYVMILLSFALGVLIGSP